MIDELDLLSYSEESFRSLDPGYTQPIPGGSLDPLDIPKYFDSLTITPVLRNDNCSASNPT